MFNTIMCLVSSVLAVGVVIWAFHEYADDKKTAALIAVWELLCLAAVFALFFPW